MEKNGFTLVEILITLVIIGIVAALTIPAVIEKYQEKVTVNKLKKMYSVLSSAYNMYKNDQQPENFILPMSKEGAEEAYKIFKPYLNVVKDCGINGQGCFYMEGYKWLNGSNATNFGTANTYYKVLLADGASIAFRGGKNSNTSASQIVIYYDVNNAAGPNTVGKDMFEFEVANNMLVPLGDNEYFFKKDCYDEGANGVGCTAWTIFNENQDYLRCKGLAWNGPVSCKNVKK